MSIFFGLYINQRLCVLTWICSGVHWSRLTDLTLEMWTPRLRWIPAQRMHMNTPRFQDAHRGPETGETLAWKMRNRVMGKGADPTGFREACAVSRSPTEATVSGYVKFWGRTGPRPSAGCRDAGDRRRLWADAGQTLILVDTLSCKEERRVFEKPTWVNLGWHHLIKDL